KLSQSGQFKLGVLFFILMLATIFEFSAHLPADAQYNANISARMYYAITPTGTITPGTVLWYPQGPGSAAGSTSSVSVTNNPTPDTTKVAGKDQQLTANTLASARATEYPTVVVNVVMALTATPTNTATPTGTLTPTNTPTSTPNGLLGALISTLKNNEPTYWCSVTSAPITLASTPTDFLEIMGVSGKVIRIQDIQI